MTNAIYIEDQVLARHWFPVCPVDQLDSAKPIGTTVFDKAIVVWRSSEKVVAWQDQCAHRGAKLSLGEICNERLRCPYHGWEYGAQGVCELIPADPNGRIPDRAKALETYKAAEHAGLVWINLSSDPAELPAPPEFEDENYGVLAVGPFEIHSSALRLCENFLDVSHIPFVHDGLLGNSSCAEVPEYHVDLTEQGIFTPNIVTFLPDQGNIDKMIRSEFTYGILSPSAVYTARNESGSDVPTQRKSLMLAVRPVTEDRCCAYFSLAWHGTRDKQRLAEIIEFDIAILMQDKPVVESQEPKCLPLDTKSEIQLKSDVLTSAYRRYLKKIGVTYGAL